MPFYDDFLRIMSPVISAYHRLEVHGTENLPPAGEGFILAPNHSGWFGWDAVVISSTIRERQVRWLSWSYEKEHPLWDKTVGAFNCILYNNEKPFPYEYASEEVLKKGDVVGIFPEGNSNPVSRWYRLRPFFPGCVRLAAMADVPIVPVAVAGLEEASPILWAKEEKNEPIKTAVALPVVFPTKAIVHFGEPVRYDIGGTGGNDDLWAAAGKLQSEVLKLLRKYRPRAYAENRRGERIVV